MAFIAPLLYWCYKTSKTLNSDIVRLSKLYFEVTNDIPKSMEDLQKIQKDISEHRKNCCLIPNWLHSIFKENDESVIKKTAEIDKKNL